jgi:hypothetical protein
MPSTTTGYTNPDGTLNYSALLNSLGTIGGSVAGGVTANNAAGAQVTGTSNAITQANTGNQAVQGIYSGQQTLGNNSFTQLASALGLPGSTPLSSNFLSQIPGLTQAENQGQTAAQNMIAAGGNLYNSGTPGLVGNYISSQIALPAYQSYVQNLLSTANLGNQANQGLSQAQMTTSGNIEQLNQNMGQENASGVSGVGGAITSGLTSLLGGSNSGSNLSSIGSLLSSLFGGSSSGSIGGTIPNIGVSDLGGGVSTSPDLGPTPTANFDQFPGDTASLIDPPPGLTDLSGYDTSDLGF